MEMKNQKYKLVVTIIADSSQAAAAALDQYKEFCEHKLDGIGDSKSTRIKGQSKETGIVEVYFDASIIPGPAALFDEFERMKHGENPP